MAEYGVDIALRVTGEERLNKVLRAAGQLEARMKSIKAIDITAPGAGKLGDDIRKALVPFRDLARESINTGKGLKNTQARMQAVAESFKFLSSNAKIGTADFKNFTIAADNQARALQKVAIEQENVIRSARGMQSVQERELQLAKRQTLLTTLRRQRDAGVGVQGPALPPRAAAPAATFAQTVGRRVPGAIGGAAIGGAFPLLFGQGAGAAAGGAIGGLLGGLAGPGGSFAGSLVGTLLGDIASKGQKIKELATDIGFSAEQTKMLGQAFQSAGRDFDKFQAAVQNIRGIGLSIEDQADAIALSSKLAGEYGGKVDKIAQAFANFASTGKVGIADINRFTAQGVPILDALEKRYGKNRDQILQMAKDGKISAQDLANALVDVANSAQNSAKKTDTGFTKAFRLIREGAELNFKAILALLSPFTNAFASTAANIAVVFAQLYKNMVTGAISAAQQIAGALVNVARALSQYAGVFTLGGFNKVAVFAQDKFKALEQSAIGMGTALRGVKLEESVQKVGGIEIPGELPDATKADKAAKAAAAKAEAEKKRVQEVIRAQGLITLENQRQLLYKDQIFKAEMANDPVLARRLQGEQQLLEWGIETANLLEKEKNSNAQLAIAKAQQAKQTILMQEIYHDLARLDLQQLSAGYDTQTQLQQELYILEQALQGKEQQAQLEVAIANTVKDMQPAQAAATADLMRRLELKREEVRMQQELNTLVNQLGTSTLGVFEDLIFATNSWQQSLAGALQMMASSLLRFGLNTLADAGDPTGQGIGLFSILTGRFGKRAAGGPVSAGSSYLVGERGPEMFVPRTSGSIYPNDAMGIGGGNITVNVDATGTSVQGNGDDSKRLGEAIGVAIRQELIKQKRPGGLLA